MRWNAVSFLALQAVEQALKSLVVLASDRVPPRVHDLVRLVEVTGPPGAQLWLVQQHHVEDVHHAVAVDVIAEFAGVDWAYAFDVSGKHRGDAGGVSSTPA